MSMNSEMVSSSDELMTISSQRNNNFCGEYTRKYCFGKILHRIHDEVGHPCSTGLPDLLISTICDLVSPIIYF